MLLLGMIGLILKLIVFEYCIFGVLSDCIYCVNGSLVYDLMRWEVVIRLCSLVGF